MQGQYSLRSPAVKRLMREAQELHEPTEQYHAQPLEDNLFEWHFTLRGPVDSDFSGGIYHGRIILPPDYPMKPPSIILLTPNGRFETHKKICLSISGYHPESWQPSWSIRTALLAIIGFMPTHGNGAIGSLDYTPEERQMLAKRSNSWKCPNCGDLRDVLPEPTGQSETDKEAKELAAQITFKAEQEAANKNPAPIVSSSESKVETVVVDSAAPSLPNQVHSEGLATSSNTNPWSMNTPVFPTIATNGPHMVPRFPPPFISPPLIAMYSQFYPYLSGAYLPQHSTPQMNLSQSLGMAQYNGLYHSNAASFSPQTSSMDSAITSNGTFCSRESSKIPSDSNDISKTPCDHVTETCNNASKTENSEYAMLSRVVFDISDGQESVVEKPNETFPTASDGQSENTTGQAVNTVENLQSPTMPISTNVASSELRRRQSAPVVTLTSSNAELLVNPASRSSRHCNLVFAMFLTVCIVLLILRRLWRTMYV